MIQFEVPAELPQYLKKDFLVVGLGNELRGDDGIGVYIVKKGREKFPGKFLDGGMTIENYIFKIIDYPEKTDLLIDAVDFNARPGSMKLVQFSELREQGISTHSLSLDKIAWILKEAGKTVLLLGIQGKNVSVGDEISQEVKESADCLLSFLFKKLEVLNA